jgi:hypothetical protein
VRADIVNIFRVARCTPSIVSVNDSLRDRVTSTVDEPDGRNHVALPLGVTAIED